MNSKKINIAAYKVFQTLLFLYDQNLSMEELVEKLDSVSEDKHNNFVISKYINTCKSCAIDIQKMGGKYALVNFPFGDKFSPDETKLLCDLAAIADLLEIEDKEEVLNTLFRKFHLPYYKSSNGLKSSENYRYVRIFEKACVSNAEVKITFSDSSTKKYFPIDITVKDKKIFLKVKSNDKEELINPADVIEIEPLDKKVRRTRVIPETVDFVLKGKLAKRYQPRENEVITLFKRNGDIVVSSKYEEKSELLHRLMRYDSLCKIIRPKSYVDEFKKMINDTLDNYK